jgi:hypothetical protein
VTAPHVESAPAPVETRAAGRLDAAVEALTRLRGVLDNDELTEQIPVELRQLGFTRLLFTRDDGDGRSTPSPEPPADYEHSPRVSVPILLWRTPVGHLHADSTDVQANDASVLRMLAEGVGAIFERNLLADRLRTMYASAREHARAIGVLSEAPAM